MGELRTNLLALQKQIVAASKASDATSSAIDAADKKVLDAYKNLQDKFDTLWQYLDSALESKNLKLNQQLHEKLSAHADSEVLKLVKAVDSAADAVVSELGEVETALATVPRQAYDAIDTLQARIGDNIAKKRAKLFNSKKYKAKLTGYDKALDELHNAIWARRKAINDLKGKPRVTADDVAKLRVKVTMKLSEINDRVSGDVKTQWDQMKAGARFNSGLANTLGDTDVFKQLFTKFKDWAQEADAMDAEVVALDPSIAKKLTEISIRSGTQVVATAPKGDYLGMRGMDLKDVKWEKGFNYKKVSQKKVKVFAKGTDGSLFQNDMKVTGGGDDTCKLGRA